ncbi:MAG: DUF1295 domain-containing protein [Acidobacteriota bacterium]|nr:DUF1295 domain-containing protein [Acidobacteriota bacterium]
MGFEGPANLLEWVLLASGLAAFVVMGIGLQKFFITPTPAERQAILFQESAIAVAVLHCVGIITRDSPGDSWTVTGIALYVLAVALFLAAVEATGDVMLPRAFAASEAATPLLTNGVYRLFRHPVYLAYSLAWAAAPIATHSPTLGVTALIMIVLHVIAARRQDRLLAERRGAEYRAYRRWWR